MLLQRCKGVWYYYMTPGFNFIGSGLDVCGTLAVSSITDLTCRLGKSFLHLVQSSLGVFASSKGFPEMLHFFLGELWIVTGCLGPMGESTNDIVFGCKILVVLCKAV